MQVPITPSQKTKIGPQPRLGIYVGYNSLSIIRFLEPLMGDLFTVKFVNCHFDKTHFPSLGTLKASKEEKQKKLIFSRGEKKMLGPKVMLEGGE